MANAGYSEFNVSNDQAVTRHSGDRQASRIRLREQQIPRAMRRLRFDSAKHHKCDTEISQSSYNIQYRELKFQSENYFGITRARNQ